MNLNCCPGRKSQITKVVGMETKPKQGRANDERKKSFVDGAKASL